MVITVRISNYPFPAILHLGPIQTVSYWKSASAVNIGPVSIYLRDALGLRLPCFCQRNENSVFGKLKDMVKSASQTQ